MIDSMRNEFRVTLRRLGRTPGFALVIISTLAIAIGGLTVTFSVVDGVLLRPLPFPDDDELVHVTVDGSGVGVPELPFSDRGYWHFHNNNHVFDAFGGHATERGALIGDGVAVQVSVARMSRSAFEVLGVAPALGRLPTADEDAPNGPLVAVISHGLWRSRYGASASVLGRSINLNGESYQVIGVMPQGFRFPTPENEIWIPLQLNAASENYRSHHIDAIARLEDGVTIEEARSDARALVARFGEAGYTAGWLNGVFTGAVNIRTLREEMVGDVRRNLLILFGAAAFVFLIACANVAGLLAARSEARLHETAVRIALGAGRGRLLGDQFVENSILAIAGGLVGLLFAYLGLQALLAWQPIGLPRLDELEINLSVLLFVFAVSLLATVLIWAVTARHLHLKQANAALRQGRRTLAGEQRRYRMRKALIIGQVALALALLVGAGLMVRSFQKLRAVDPGFDPAQILTFQISPPSAYYPDADATSRLYVELLDRIRSLPGVVSAGGITTLPLTSGGAVRATQVEGFTVREGEAPPTFAVRRVTPGYFETMRIPLLEGRVFDSRDHQERLGTAIISSSIERRFWPTSSALGRRVAPSTAPAVIVGLVEDIHHTGLDAPPDPMIYLPMLDSQGGAVREMTIVVRTGVTPTSIIPAIRREVSVLGANFPMSDFATMESIVGDSIARTNLTMFLLTIGALTALLLGTVGIYGVISYIVGQRTREIGLRLALGATPANIRGIFLRQGLNLVVLGVALGLLLATATGQLLSAFLFGVSPFDMPTVAAAALIFLATSGVASFIPARRATFIPPMTALRQD